MNLIRSGTMTCGMCHVETAPHASHLCEHCRLHDCQCYRCMTVTPWEDLRFGICASCYVNHRLKYHLTKKERVCQPK